MQIALYRHYLLANIGEQYMRLDWANYHGDAGAIDAVDLYLAKWPTAKRLGMGLEFSSPQLGVGKTWAATHVGKTLIKQGVAVYFTTFKELVGAYHRDDEEIEDRLRNTHVLILDEVTRATTGPMHELFAARFEGLVRERTNRNMPIIMTTNLTPDDLHAIYPRTYSLLEAKQIRIAMDGTDARQGMRKMRNEELLVNDEIEPIN